MAFIKSLLFVLFALGLFLAGKYLYMKPKYKTGVTAPDFEFVNLDGEKHSLSSFDNQYILLDFWGSWCAPCRAESPELVQLYDTFYSEGTSARPGFDIISVAIETNTTSWKNAILKDRLHWKNHFTENQRFKSPIVLQYGVKEVPTKYLLNPNGKIVLVNPSFAELHDFLDKKIRR